MADTMTRPERAPSGEGPAKQRTSNKLKRYVATATLLGVGVAGAFGIGKALGGGESGPATSPVPGASAPLNPENPGNVPGHNPEVPTASALQLCQYLIEGAQDAIRDKVPGSNPSPEDCFVADGSNGDRAAIATFEGDQGDWQLTVFLPEDGKSGIERIKAGDPFLEEISIPGTSEAYTSKYLPNAPFAAVAGPDNTAFSVLYDPNKGVENSTPADAQIALSTAAALATRL